MQELGGALARINSLVKLLQRPSGRQHKFELSSSLSMTVPVRFKIAACRNFASKMATPDVVIFFNMRGSLKDFSDAVIVFLTDRGCKDTPPRSGHKLSHTMVPAVF